MAGGVTTRSGALAVRDARLAGARPRPTRPPVAA